MLEFPFETPDVGDAPVAVAEGVFWLRLPLPFVLDHVNLWLIDDGDGWTIIDSGLDFPPIRAAWRRIFAFIGGGHRLKRLIVTHHHMDHVGMAAAVQRETGCAVLMTAPEVEALGKSLIPDAADREQRLTAHYMRLGAAEAEAMTAAKGRSRIEAFVSGIPEGIAIAAPGETVTIGGQPWRASTGDGHTDASLILTRGDGALMIAGDQILSHISPFIGAMMNNRDDDPLADYLAFLGDIGPRIAAGTLVLPGHRPPFRGGRERCAELAAHHHERCEAVLAGCAAGPVRIRALLPLLFRRSLEGVLGLALAETLAHVNYLANRGRLRRFEVDGRLMIERTG